MGTWHRVEYRRPGHKQSESGPVTDDIDLLVKSRAGEYVCGYVGGNMIDIMYQLSRVNVRGGQVCMIGPSSPSRIRILYLT